MSQQKITIEYHQNTIPDFVDATMERLYQNLYCARKPMEIYGKLHGNVDTYVVRADDIATTVLLFRREANRIVVLNELIAIEQHDIKRFASFAFGIFKNIHVILFNAIQIGRDHFSWVHQQYNHSEDIVLSLPATQKDYWQRLGKSTRSYLTRYQNKLARSLPNMAWRVVQGGEDSALLIADLIALNKARMSSKEKSSSNDTKRTQQLITLARDFGFIVVGEIEGKVCAGTVNYRVGDNYFLEVIAHDPAYDDYRLGTIACYLTIGECIARGGHEYHFLWGRYTYKFRLLGVQRNLDNLVLYRSRLAAFFNARTVMRSNWAGYRRRTRLWLLARMTPPRSRWANVMVESLSIMRRLKRGIFMVWEKL